MKNVVDAGMLEVMSRPEIKGAGLIMEVMLNDGTKRKGVYVDLVENPLNNPSFKGVQFAAFMIDKPEKDTKVYLPVPLIATIEWSY